MTTPPTTPATATTAARTADFLDSSALLDDPAALRARADEHGYLFFRGLLPIDDVLDLRRRFLQIVRRYGWLVDGTPVSDGIADVAAFDRVPREETAFCGVGITRDAYADIQRVRQFHELAHHPRLLAVYRNLFGADVLPHPRNIARVVIPGGGTRPTPPHQDFIHIQGTPRVWTAWFPLGDCPRELGGLSVLSGSNREGLMSYHAAEGAGGLEAYLCDLDLPWAQGDFAAGDVLTFSSHTVHRALPHAAGDRVRLSCDFRYQPAAEPLHEGSLRVHCDVLGWEEVYADWPDPPDPPDSPDSPDSPDPLAGSPGDVRWYWRDMDLRRSEWDESIRWQKDRIC
ncbi:phytanoyl-CoA dioxygenase family protein [Actinopolymorpha rutila]|uniref:Phytanoyl-CoA dioxygenase (PhyH) n=1 Tax=Actinopolymorpha rutila TaxID=446787 RepID=A0A852Z5W2_9ACTN|nr:phytanoyl-CoA dioxygenase family protein [Actinopolymorpha rutila]NYH88717.1 hypothetical protein [Actinopolymorpha rutila]